MKKGKLSLKENIQLTEIFRFVIVGGISFAVDYSILYVLTEFGGINYLVSSTVGFMVSVMVNYFLCIIWVFEGAAKKDIRTTTAFMITSILGLLINQFILWLLVDIFGIYYLIAKIVATFVVMIWNYITKRKAIVK